MKRFLFLVLVALVPSIALAQYSWSAPGSVATGQSYTVSASFDWSGDWVDLYKNGTWVAGGWGAASYTTSDGSAGTSTFQAETSYWEGGTYTDVCYVTVVQSNVPPVASVVVDGLSSGQTVTRPNGGSLNVTVRYRATDANGNLTGIRPQIWQPNGSLDNNGGAFVGQNGGSGEVVRTVTLNQNGDWYFWTDAQDATIAPDSVNSGAWSSGFRLTVNEAAPPNQTPVVQSVTADRTFVYVGESTVIHIRATDGNGNLRYVSLDRIDGNGNTYGAWFGPGDSFSADSPPSNGSYDIGGNSSDYTRNLTMTFPTAGVYRFRGYAADTDGASGYNAGSADLVVTVGRTPTGSMQILDNNHNPITPDGNGRARVALGQQFYVRVNGSDADGNLSSLWVRLNKPDGSGSMWEVVGSAGGSAYNDFGPRTADTLGVWDAWAHVVDTTNTGYQWNGGGWYGIGGPDVEVYQTNQSPSSVTINTPPATIRLGEAVSLSSTAVDPDGNLTTHVFWRRGPRTADTFGQDWTGWLHYWDSSDYWSYSTNAGSSTGGGSSSISATFTPPSAGFWQFLVNAGDAAGAWGPSAATSAVFVAPLPTATISATTSSGASANGGGTVVAYTTDTVSVSSTATASGWLSEHNVFSYLGTTSASTFYWSPGGGVLAAENATTTSTRSGTWTPPSQGTFTLYTEAFTGRSAGERVNGTSGYPGYFDGAADRRITVQVRRNPTATIQILDASRTPITPNGSAQAPLAVGSTFYVRVFASNPDGSLGLLYAWITPPGGPTMGGNVAVSGTSASYDFGPYTVTATGVWDILGHATDVSAAGWGSIAPWDGNKFGWSTVGSPDILGVGVSPTISSHPASATVTAGQAASFAVSAAGTAPLAYQWAKNGSAISGATSSTYSLASTVTSDSATYTVVVSNAYGSTTSNGAVLTVNASTAAPVITSQPSAVTVTAGQSASFSVAVTGTPAPGYQWRKGGSNITGATSSSYSIASTTAADAGSYSVFVSNSAGSATSNSATLAVNSAPVAPSISTQPASQTVNAGQAVSFTVVASGTPAPGYQWRKNGTNISGATAATYTITATSAADAAGYAVVVANSAGTATSSTATLTVNTITIPVTLWALTPDIDLSSSTPVFVSGGEGSGDWIIECSGGALSGLGDVRTFSASSKGTYTITAHRAIGGNTGTLAVNVRDPQAPVSSADAKIEVGQAFKPVLIGGSGSGGLQFVVTNQTNWPELNGLFPRSPGTLVGFGPPVGKWNPPAGGSRTWTFYVRRIGDATHGYSNTAGPYQLTITGDDVNGNGIPDEIEQAAGTSNLTILHYEYDANGQLIADPQRTYTPDAEGNIK